MKLKECYGKDNIKARSGSYKLNSIQPMAHHDAQKKLEEMFIKVHKSKDEQIHGFATLNKLIRKYKLDHEN